MTDTHRTLGKIEDRPIGEIKVYDRNARAHPRDQIEALKGSIAAFGFNAPILIDENDVIIAGHGRLEAGRQCGARPA